MGDAEVHAAAPTEDFLADGAAIGIGIVLGMLFGKVDADLHRPAGAHRVQAAEQGLAHGQGTDQFIEQVAELFFAAHRIQPLAIGLAGRRAGLQGGVDQQVGDMQAGGAAVDLLPGDAAQTRYFRVGLEGRFLLGDRQHRAQVALAGGDLLRGKGALDIPRPAFAVLGGGRQQAHDLGAHLGRGLLRRFTLGDAALNGQRHADNNQPTG
ncbi:hypothetical protein D3C76_1088270 [compost metagenome]